MQERENNKPPFFKNWNGWYISLIAFLVVLIVLFYLFTENFK